MSWSRILARRVMSLLWSGLGWWICERSGIGACLWEKAVSVWVFDGRL